jgi:Putative adhesin
MTTWDFPCSEPVDISVDSWLSGSIAISGEPTTSILVEVLPTFDSRGAEELLQELQVSFDDGRLYVRGPRYASHRRKTSLDLIIKTPAGSACTAKTASADVACIGELGELTVQTASGDVTADVVSGDVTIHSASGDVLLNGARGDVTINTASGDIQANKVEGDLRVNTASGDVAVGYCSGSVSSHTASGDVGLGCVVSGQVDLVSVSGDLEVAVVPGIGVYLDLASTSGDVRSDLAASDGDAAAANVSIKCRTLSGDIRIGRSRQTAGSGAAAQEPVTPEPAPQTPAPALAADAAPAAEAADAEAAEPNE